MATNTGDDHRDGSVRDRIQKPNPKGGWDKIDTNTGKVIDTKPGDPWKGVAKDKDGRRK